MSHVHSSELQCEVEMAMSSTKCNIAVHNTTAHHMKGAMTVTIVNTPHNLSTALPKTHVKSPQPVLWHLANKLCRNRKPRWRLIIYGGCELGSFCTPPFKEPSPLEQSHISKDVGNDYENFQLDIFIQAKYARLCHTQKNRDIWTEHTLMQANWNKTIKQGRSMHSYHQ